MKVLAIFLNDIEVYSLLMNLRTILNNKKFSSDIHITIKGPQKSFKDNKSINELLKNKHPINIEGVGMFSNNDVYIVYLKVQCDAIKGHMWRKSDYKDEYNPHITIYKGHNKNKAEKIEEFLLNENISLICKNYEVQIIDLVQLTLPIFQKKILTCENEFEKLFDSNAVKKGIFTRAHQLFSFIEKETITRRLS